jgi:hypothetical protein
MHFCLSSKLCPCGFFIRVYGSWFVFLAIISEPLLTGDPPVERAGLSFVLSSIFPRAAGDCFARVPPQGLVFADDFHFILRFS